MYLSQCERLQDEINNLVKWADKWLMSFNTDKCVVMHLGNGNVMYAYYMNGVLMKTTECEKDIGVYMTPSLKPSVHIAEAVKKANRALGTLLRCLSYRDRFHYIRLYKQYVRCHLETAVQAWSPWLVQDIEKIEAVQRRAINKCYGLYGTYTEKLKAVGLTTLSDRRSRGDMLQTFKIMQGIDDVDYHSWFTKVSHRHQKTRQAVNVLEEGRIVENLNVMKSKARLDVRKNFYSCRVVDSWNSLPLDIQCAGNVQDFKEKFDNYIAGNLLF